MRDKIFSKLQILFFFYRNVDNSHSNFFLPTAYLTDLLCSSFFSGGVAISLVSLTWLSYYFGQCMYYALERFFFFKFCWLAMVFSTCFLS